MSSKKWLVMFAAAVLLALGAYASVNIAVDPFGVFGDRIFDWYSYDETNNPRVAKLAWLDEHHDEFDSYVIGSSSAASYNVEELNRYLDADFYNLFVYGCDTRDYRYFAEYLLENYTVKNLVLNIGINEANYYGEEDGSLNGRMHARASGESLVKFYLSYAFCPLKYSKEKLDCLRRDTELPQVFDVFDVDSGCYDKRVRDVEKIGDMDVYMAEHGGDFRASGGGLEYIDECVRTVSEISRMCKERGVRLTVINSPVYISQWDAYSEESLREYKTSLAEAVDFWDFSLTPISYDSRYFYDATHFRNDVGSMVLSEIFGGDVWTPESFGTYVTRENCSEYLDGLFGAAPKLDESEYTSAVPILMYHSFDSDPDAGVTPERFEEHLAALRDAGCVTVSVEEMIDYVLGGGELPERAVCITMDDGYMSNYEIALPLLEKYGMKGTVFAIGVSVGHDRYYKDTDFELTPHFGYGEAREMAGVIDFQSHSYDMHQWPPFESGSSVRENMLPFEWESEAEYAAVLRDDMEKYEEERVRELGEGFSALSYPEGQYNTLTEVLVHEAGIKLTMSSDTDRKNVLVRGLTQSLYALCRYDVTNGVTGEQIISYLEGQR